MQTSPMQMMQNRITETKRIAIVGYAQAHRHLAPLKAEDNWTVWAVNELGMEQAGVYHAWFNLHRAAELRRDYPKNVEWLKNCTAPVFTLDEMPEIPSNEIFPVDLVKASVPQPYFRSSIAWMVAYAMMYKIEEIGIWGVDMLYHSEYGYQKPNLEWLLGIAQGKGIKVTLPDNCALLQGSYLYGVEDPPLDNGPVNEKFLRDRAEMLIKDVSEAHDRAVSLKGQLEDTHRLLMHIDRWKKENPIQAICMMNPD